MFNIHFIITSPDTDILHIHGIYLTPPTAGDHVYKSMKWIQGLTTLTPTGNVGYK